MGWFLNNYTLSKELGYWQCNIQTTFSKAKVDRRASYLGLKSAKHDLLLLDAGPRLPIRFDPIASRRRRGRCVDRKTAI